MYSFLYPDEQTYGQTNIQTSECLFVRMFVRPDINGYKFFVDGPILTKMGLLSPSGHKESIDMFAIQIRQEMKE